MKSKEIKEIILKIEQSVRSGIFTDVEKTKIELMLGEETYISYEDTVKFVLITLFRHGKYNSQALKAAEITPNVYNSLYGVNIIPKKYESLGRKVRGICRKLEKKGILKRNDKKAYSVNLEYKKQILLYFRSNSEPVLQTVSHYFLGS